MKSQHIHKAPVGNEPIDPPVAAARAKTGVECFKGRQLRTGADMNELCAPCIHRDHGPW
jgi:hypothetical protein